MNVEPETLFTLPFTVNVPPETVRVPLLVRVLLNAVQPTVKLPEAFTNVPPVLIVIFLDVLPAEFTVTVVPEAI